MYSRLILSFLFVLTIYGLAPEKCIIQYGQTCGEGVEGDCDPLKELACIDHKCDCSRPYAMVYNETLDRCLVLSGDLCILPEKEIFQYGEDSGNIPRKKSTSNCCDNLENENQKSFGNETLKNFGNETQITSENEPLEGAPLECVENAICSPKKKKCICDPNYLEDMDGLCILKKRFGEECLKNADCQKDQLMACVNGTCQCKEDVSILIGEGENRTCVGLVDAKCYYPVDSISNSSKLNSTSKSKPTRNQCVHGAICQRVPAQNGSKPICPGKCACRIGYEAKDGYCLGTHDKPCNERDLPCADELRCVNGKCKCHFPRNQYYDAEKRQCISFVNGPCWAKKNGNVYKFECVSNAECTKHNNVKMCLCKEHYVESGGLRCRANSGQPCGHCDCKKEYYDSESGDCKPKAGVGATCALSADCREDLGLSCIHGTCVCNETEAIYREDIGRCGGLPGKRCAAGRHCVEDAKCERMIDGNCCKCNEPFVDVGGRCMPGPGAQCSEEWPCAEGLKCLNETCKCQSDRREFINGGCNCKAKYITSEDGVHCLSTQGKCCKVAEDCLGGMSCFGGVCVCPFPKHQYFDAENSKCISKVRGPCKEEVEGKMREFDCIGNSQCGKSKGGIAECQCNEGYIESENRTCQIVHGAPCEENKGCDIVGDLICKDKICVCPYLAIYDEKMKKCRGLVGAVCNITRNECCNCSDSEPYCVDGAICEKFGDLQKVQGTCVCKDPSKTRVKERDCKVKKIVTSVGDRDFGGDDEEEEEPKKGDEKAAPADNKKAAAPPPPSASKSSKKKEDDDD